METELVSNFDYKTPWHKNSVGNCLGCQNDLFIKHTTAWKPTNLCGSFDVVRSRVSFSTMRALQKIAILNLESD